MQVSSFQMQVTHTIYLKGRIIPTKKRQALACRMLVEYLDDFVPEHFFALSFERSG